MRDACSDSLPCTAPVRCKGILRGVHAPPFLTFPRKGGKGSSKQRCACRNVAGYSPAPTERNDDMLNDRYEVRR